ncbi:hypothetical protein IJ674_02515 [bacterium]|nr:hypothetical protein [bacterium]
MIAHCVKVGHLESARRSFRRAKRFLPTGKNTYYCVSSLMPPSGGIVSLRFSLSLVPFLSLLLAIKEKEMNRQKVLISQ